MVKTRDVQNAFVRPLKDFEDNVVGFSVFPKWNDNQPVDSFFAEFFKARSEEHGTIQLERESMIFNSFPFNGEIYRITLARMDFEKLSALLGEKTIEFDDKLFVFRPLGPDGSDGFALVSTDYFDKCISALL